MLPIKNDLIGGSIEVSMLAFYSGDSSLNPTDDQFILVHYQHDRKSFWANSLSNKMFIKAGNFIPADDVKNKF